MRAGTIGVILSLILGFGGSPQTAGRGRASSTRLEIVRTLPAPRAAVFQAWTDVNSIRLWFPYHAKVHWIEPPAVDARVGGRFRWQVASDSDEKEVFAFHGAYRELTPARKLTFTWEWDSLPISGVEMNGHTVINVSFISNGQNTTVVLRQTGFRTDAARAAHEKGWNRCLDGIEEVLSGRQP